MVSAIERCPLFLSAIKRFFYETLTMILSILRKSVRFRKAFAIKHVRYMTAIERFNCNLIFLVQWNLSIADMLYSGHLSIADTFPKNGWNHGQSLIEKPLYSGQK